jgi:hypothetical protein
VWEGRRGHGGKVTGAEEKGPESAPTERSRRIPCFITSSFLMTARDLIADSRCNKYTYMLPDNTFDERKGGEMGRGRRKGEGIGSVYIRGTHIVHSHVGIIYGGCIFTRLILRN